MITDERVRLVYAQPFFTFIKVFSASHVFNSFPLKVLWRLASDDTSRCGYTGSCSCDPTHRRLKTLVVSSLTETAKAPGNILSD
ncbi:hypothetical protein DPMN_027673 [Dreissena polymorpha]|uniref:Uncharacterized protein n=1 Tax=Dreissena polymorpha TaxID=45954 RepID=A0A9D4LTD6_DREPO|nr:hypothetical protein DPMN_027673 [Dreissena polymorpha]